MAKPALRHSKQTDCTHSEIRRLTNAIRGTPVTLFEHDCSLRYTWVFNSNPKISILNNQIIGKTDAQLFSNQWAKKLTQIKKSALHSGKNTRTEISVEIDGQTLYFDLSIEPLRNASGSIVGLSCAAFDITERKQLDMNLREP
jgi:PAS domain-containing protein